MTTAGGGPATGYRLGELAAAIGGEVRGDAAVRIVALRSLEQAGIGHLAFVGGAAFKERAQRSVAAALLVPPALAAALGDGGERPLLIAERPGLARIRLLELLYPQARPPAGVHPTAVVGEGCEVAADAYVGPYAVIGDGSRIGAGAAVHAHAVVGRRCRLGAGAVLHPHVVLYDDTEVGARVVVHAGAVLGADGFGYESDAAGHHKVPQVGRTVIEDDAEIGALSAVDRAALEETRIGAGTKIDNLVQVGHNVTIGRGCILCGQSGVAGSARLEDYVVLGGQAGVAGHLTVARGVKVAAKSAVLQEVGAGAEVGGVPAIELARWRRQVMMLPRLGELARRIRALEKKLAQTELEERGEVRLTAERAGDG